MYDRTHLRGVSVTVTDKGKTHLKNALMPNFCNFVQFCTDSADISQLGFGHEWLTSLEIRCYAICKDFALFRIV